MIAKLPGKRKDGKSSFHNLINYITGILREEAVIYVASQNVFSTETAAIEMEALAIENTRCKDPAFHFILSWRELELPTKKQVDEAVHIALKELDLQDCQAIWALQADTENRHVHVAVNRIDPETTKAIQPAGNWTKKALERAARKIELTQGWEIEQSGRYVVTADGELKEKSIGLREEVKISQTARDIEAHTATKSAERVVQEVGAELIRKARSWEELHRTLGEQGIVFEQKGSGAVLRIGETHVKASKIGRDLSMSKLIGRLGEYREVENVTEIIARAPEPVERAALPGVRDTWEAYQKARTDYFGAKKAMTEELRERHKKERGNLQQEQKEERAKAFSMSWTGKGAELNRQRSIMAAVQQAAKLDFRDQHQQERGELKKQFPARFPSFKTWLEQERDPELAVLFRYPDGLTFLNQEMTSAQGHDLRAYTPLKGNKGGIAYVRGENGAGRADFVDYGLKIAIDKRCDETAVLAALQLATQKWGAVQINGTEEYKHLCVEVAAKHNLKIANPELAQEVEEIKSKKGNEIRQPNSTDQARTDFERYAAAVGAERYRIVATEFTPEGVKAFIFDRKNCGLDGKSHEEFLVALPKLLNHAKNGKNINVVPLSRDKHHILVDDLNEKNLKQLKEDGYLPSCVIESSPGNFQAVITVPKIDGENREAGNRMTKELNEKYGDPKLAGVIHAHRLPPFPNLKPKHQREDGTYPATVLAESNGGVCTKTTSRLAEIREQIRTEELKRQREQKHRERASNIAGWNASTIDPKEAYWAHYRDIMQRLRGDMDYSRVDGMIGVRMRVTGYSVGQIEAAIKDNAPVMRKASLSATTYDAKYRNRDWNRFAKETVEKFVFGSRGATQYAQAEAYRPYYMKLEGRSLAEEQRREQQQKGHER